MRRVFFLLAIGLILTFRLEAKKVEGKVFFKHDTIHVTFNIPIKLFKQEPNFERLQYRIKGVDSNGKKIILFPDDAREIRFKYGDENVRMLSRYNSIGFRHMLYPNNNIFLRLKVDGPLKLFCYYYTENTYIYDDLSGGYYYGVEEYILQMADGELKRPKALAFKKDMVEYFSSCPALAEKIENKSFRKNDLEAIVTDYNSACPQ